MKNDVHNGDWLARRLAELKKYPLDLTVPDVYLDRIATELLAVCQTHSVVISFYGNSPSTIKAWAGEKIMPNEKVMFCDLVLHLSGYVEVEDTLNHPYFKHNPEVLGSSGVRFFSSTPLVNRNGFVLGSLCALNRKPLRFTTVQRNGITTLGSQVIVYLESKRTS